MQAVEEVHAAIAKATPELRTAAVSAASAHVTLAVCHLKDDTEAGDRPKTRAGGASCLRPRPVRKRM